MDRYPTEHRGCRGQASANFHFRAEPLVARDLRHFETAPETVAADLEALVVRQHVRALLRKCVEPDGPPLVEPSESRQVEVSHHEILTPRIVDEIEGRESAAEAAEAFDDVARARILRSAVAAPTQARAQLEHAQTVVAQACSGPMDRKIVQSERRR